MIPILMNHLMNIMNIYSIHLNMINSIKIKHKSNKRNSFNRIVCVFGILVNERGIEISNSMIEWLLPEYDVYCIYQKYLYFTYLLFIFHNT